MDEINNFYLSISHEIQKKDMFEKSEIKINFYFRLYIDICACVHSRLLGGVNTKNFRIFPFFNL